MNNNDLEPSVTSDISDDLHSANEKSLLLPKDAKEDFPIVAIKKPSVVKKRFCLGFGACAIICLVLAGVFSTIVVLASTGTLSKIFNFSRGSPSRLDVGLEKLKFIQFEFHVFAYVYPGHSGYYYTYYLVSNSTTFALKTNTKQFTDVPLKASLPMDGNYACIYVEERTKPDLLLSPIATGTRCFDPYYLCPHEACLEGVDVKGECCFSHCCLNADSCKLCSASNKHICCETKDDSCYHTTLYEDYCCHNGFVGCNDNVTGHCCTSQEECCGSECAEEAFCCHNKKCDKKCCGTSRECCDTASGYTCCHDDILGDVCIHQDHCCEGEVCKEQCCENSKVCCIAGTECCQDECVTSGTCCKDSQGEQQICPDIQCCDPKGKDVCCDDEKSPCCHNIDCWEEEYCCDAGIDLCTTPCCGQNRECCKKDSHQCCKNTTEQESYCTENNFCCSGEICPKECCGDVCCDIGQECCNDKCVEKGKCCHNNGTVEECPTFCCGKNPLSQKCCGDGKQQVCCADGTEEKCWETDQCCESKSISCYMKCVSDVCPKSIGECHCTGDPHCLTWQGIVHDFQGLGEYTIIESANLLQFNTRLYKCGTSVTCSNLNEFWHIDLGTPKITVTSNPAEMLIDGKKFVWTAETWTVKDITFSYSGPNLYFTFTTGETIHILVTSVLNFYITNLNPQDYYRNLKGICGSFPPQLPGSDMQYLDGHFANPADSNDVSQACYSYIIKDSMHLMNAGPDQIFIPSEQIPAEMLFQQSNGDMEFFEEVSPLCKQYAPDRYDNCMRDMFYMRDVDEVLLIVTRGEYKGK